LGAAARSTITDPDNEILLSVASVWEIAIKHSRHRMPGLSMTPELFIGSRIDDYDLEPLAISMTHAFAAGRLPHIHRDPFDRMLVAQSQVEGVPIVTSDANIARYDVEVIW
jgi:PIN domain nuclease of toxin-antitoxin system